MRRLTIGAAMGGALLTGALLAACSAIIGTRDLEYSPDATNGSSSGDPITDGASTADGSSTADGGDAGTCVADFATDPKHCGRCFHDCFGGPCENGTCGAIEIGAVSGAPLRSISASTDHVFVASILQLTTQTGGIWRIPKTGGAAEEYVTFRYAQVSAVLGDTLYFVVNDEPEGSGADLHGGLWSCPVSGAAPCSPTLIAAARLSRGLVIANNRVMYGDDQADKGLMAYTPPTKPPVVYRAGFGFASTLFVDAEFFAYGVTFALNQPYRASVLEGLPDGGIRELYRYENANAADGDIVGTSDALYYTAWDYDVTSGGRVRRIPRPGKGGVPCDYAGTTNKRPYGIALDETRVYWTNLGEGVDHPWTSASLNACDLAGCCAQPTVLWTGGGEPSGLTVDDTSLYWVSNAGGSVYRMAKP
jgi:hypothetical protein